MTVRTERRRRISILVMLIAAGSLRVGALAVNNPVFDYSMDLPIGWVQADNTDAAHIGFYSPNADAMVQVIALDPTRGGDGLGIAQSMLETMSGRGEPVAFRYQALPAALSDVTFQTSGMEAKGYLITISARQADFVLLAFAVGDAYESAHDHLLSVLDSFGLGEPGRLAPGPVSQFFYPFPAPDARSTDLRFLNVPVPFAVDPRELDATAVLVEREARLLAPYGALDSAIAYDAWRRYFRMIYRDNYLRLADTAERLGAILRDTRTPRVDYPRKLLSWLQGFEYERAGGVSDFLPPMVCLSRGVGDCDSLALTYAILLHHLGFDAILMVSDQYAHALAAVDIPGPGARYEFEGRQWLIAELTAPVEIGQIAASMADPDGWIGVRLRLVPIEAQANAVSLARSQVIW